MIHDAQTLTPKPHILVVDDDTRLRALLKKFLSGEGFAVTVAENAKEARECMEFFRFDGMVLDVMMPGETGTAFAQALSEPRPPIIILSALGEAEHRITGLEAGALDYLPKPFEPKELVLRLRNIMRRGSSASSPVMHFGQYSFDKEYQKLMRGSEAIALTTAELQMLLLLLDSAGKPVSREVLSAIGGPASSERSVDVQVTRLRKKLDDGSGISLIRTIRGAGYVIYTEPL